MAAVKLTDLTLVQWIDEKIGIMAVSSVVKGYMPSVGAVVPMKWNKGREQYDVEILKSPVSH